MKSAHPIRILIADDSATSRAALRKLLESDALISVVGEAHTGEQALKLSAELHPSLVLMDVMMPGMDGIAATRRMMQEMPTPIVIVSELAGNQGDLHFQALDAGALDIVRKPSSDDLLDPHFRTRFCRLMRGLSLVPLVTRTAGRAGQAVQPYKSDSPAPKSLRFLSRAAAAARERPAGNIDRLFDQIQWIAIGASTGGPPAIRTLLLNFAPKAPWPIFIVQHITAGFEDSMADWLRDECHQNVVLAQSGMIPAAGTAYLAPVGRHLVLRNGELALDSNHPHRLHCPSINLLFESLASSGTAHQGIAILLTGMGSDGASGLLSLRKAGAKTIVQDEASCAVFGMPKAAVDMGAAEEILPLEAIGPRLISLSRIRGASAMH